jgi:hypothetical protein
MFDRCLIDYPRGPYFLCVTAGIRLGVHLTPWIHHPHPPTSITIPPSPPPCPKTTPWPLVIFFCRGGDLQNLEFVNRSKGHFPGTDVRVQQLWQVLGEFSPQERALFMRFVSGRERLPVSTRLQVRALAKEKICQKKIGCKHSALTPCTTAVAKLGSLCVNCKS